MSDLRVPRIDARNDQANLALETLRRQLSPNGNVVSPKGKALTEKVFGKQLTPVEVVSLICQQVREAGEDAVRRFSLDLDGKILEPGELRLDEHVLLEAHTAASPEFLNCVRRIRSNIEEFQKEILHHDVSIQPREGIRLDHRYEPLRRIGVCVPGGAAAYPSTVLMTVIPAQIAGVKEIVVVAPPTLFGAYNPDVLATCYELGVKEVYPIGGAQAVAAMAYGVNGLPAVDKIVGPGNLFVALAKKHVYGDVDIDSIAGPSEVVIVADESTPPSFAASDLLAQAEHSPGASLLISWQPAVIDAIERELVSQLKDLSRSELTIESLTTFGAFILVRDRKHAAELAEWIAPEHLHIACEQPRELSDAIRTAGATFLGPFSPVALGDYAAGPSHVLPTGGTARFASGLTCNSFLRSHCVIQYSHSALNEIAPQVGMLADREGLSAHRASIDIRRTFK